LKRYTIYKSQEGKQRIQSYYDSYLRLFDVQFNRVHVETRFGNTHILVTGPLNGNPIFILQGGNCINPMTLSWFTPLLSKYRIYAPDTIGHPGYSAETRISASDNSFALWISDIMDYFKIKQSGFIGPSYGAGIILRLATYMPERISCSVLVSPSGLQLGSKFDMIKRIFLPLVLFHSTESQNQLQIIANALSFNSMNVLDKQILGELFTHVKLERNLPKQTEKHELKRFMSPTMVIAGEHDIFFPAPKIIEKAKEIIPNLISTIAYEMGHIPSMDFQNKMNINIQQFFSTHYKSVIV
jgi:pimeloyl-ACP methyl ester carboxylesterase